LFCADKSRASQELAKHVQGQQHCSTDLIF